MKAIHKLSDSNPVVQAWRKFQESETFRDSKCDGRIEEVMFRAFAAGYGFASIDAGNETAMAGPAAGEFIDQDTPQAKVMRDAMAGGAGFMRVDGNGMVSAADPSKVYERKRPYRPGGPNDPTIDREQIRKMARETMDMLYARADEVAEREKRAYQRMTGPVERPGWSVHGLQRNQFEGDPGKLAAGILSGREKPQGGALALYRVVEQDSEDGRLQAFMGADRVVYWVPRR